MQYYAQFRSPQGYFGLNKFSNSIINGLWNSTLFAKNNDIHLINYNCNLPAEKYHTIVSQKMDGVGLKIL